MNLIRNINQVLTYSYGQLLVGGSLLLNLIQDERISFAVLGGAILSDLIWGVAAAIKLKKFILSKALRETFKKIAIYCFALIGLALIEKILHENSLLGIKIAASLASACELWSISASMLIIKPDMPFLKIFRLQLKGEMESKIGKNLDHILNKDNYENKQTL